MLPSTCAVRATYAGLSATRRKVDSVGAGVGRAEAVPASVGGFEEPFIDSAREIRVIGGGLQRSKMGSSDALRHCRVLRGARTAQVVIELCASNSSRGRWFLLSPSGAVVDQMYALRSSLPHIT